MGNYTTCLADFAIGDKIKIHIIDDPFLTIDWKGKEGIIEEIDDIDRILRGTWGALPLYPEYDSIEIIERADI
jgi:hypothetical protein